MWVPSHIAFDFIDEQGAAVANAFDSRTGKPATQFAAGLVQGGDLVAVATVSLPGAVVDLTAIGTVGDGPGVDLRNDLVGRLLDIAPRMVIEPAGVQKPYPFKKLIVRSRAEDGDPGYIRLESRGMRPVKVESLELAGGHANSAMPASIRWEAGPDASEGDWSLTSSSYNGGLFAPGKG